METVVAGNGCRTDMARLLRQNAASGDGFDDRTSECPRGSSIIVPIDPVSKIGELDSSTSSSRVVLLFLSIGRSTRPRGS